ncbi:PIG-L family deacetylase [Couchioplanes caeruleus]|uniref:PIG-L deacetylase family protein n=1 Tax=Couchioplanes caeruleus TaxID=56438 RepID=UPI0020C184DB|nr:PIG-L deacetylase family protein [Couchioplanes caeruleus]UQU67727.1 PIG-L family deacetylase [Couchioplanes caeruleus]
MSDEPAGRVLVVTAHPDDAEFHFGATIAAFVAAGADVSYLVCSDGAQGGAAEVRAREQRAAAAVLGVRAVAFLGRRDGRLEPDLALRRDIALHVRRERPTLVLTHYPRRVLNLPVEASHPDHVAVGEATLAALYPDAGNARAFPDVPDAPPPHQAAEVWVPGYERPDHHVDATAHVDRKLAAIRCHRSQVGAAVPAWVLEWMRLAGKQPGYEFAEAFRRIRLT